MAELQRHSGMFSVVTGASSGIGLELAKCCAKDGMDLLLVADESLNEVVLTLRGLGTDGLTPWKLISPPSRALTPW